MFARTDSRVVLASPPPAEERTLRPGGTACSCSCFRVSVGQAVSRLCDITLEDCSGQEASFLAVMGVQRVGVMCVC